MRPKVKVAELVALVREHGPVSPNHLTELAGDFRQSIDRYIRLAHEAELIHIHSFAESPFGGNRTIKMYAIGKGIDAARPYRSIPNRLRPKKQIDDFSRKGLPYSPAEKRIMREIKFSGKTLKSQMYRLPGRTLCSVQKAMEKVRGKKKIRGTTSWVWPIILATLREEADLTTSEIAEHIGCTRRQVQSLLSENHSDKNRSVRISGWIPQSGQYAAKWSLGSGPDEPRVIVKRKRIYLARSNSALVGTAHNPFGIVPNQMMRQAA